MNRPVLETARVTKMFGSFCAVQTVSFQAGRGEILCLLGPNGAGKTTLLKLIRGLLPPTSGRILIHDSDISLRPKAAESLGYMSQKFSLYPLLTGIENIEFFAGVSGLKPRLIRQKIEELRAKVPEAILRRKTRDLAPGFKQAIALFACLMADPDILLLDEPTTGVGPDTRRSFWLEIYGLKKSGRTVLVTTHDLDEAEYADRVIILDQGRIVFDGRFNTSGRAVEDIYSNLFREKAVGYVPRA